MPHRPISRCGSAIVVSPGSRASATISRSSTPTTEQSTGTVEPDGGCRLVDAHRHLVVEAEHRGRALGRWAIEEPTTGGAAAVGVGAPRSRPVAASPAPASASWNPASRPRVAGASSVAEAIAIRRWPRRPGARPPSSRFPARRGRPPAPASRRPAPRRRGPSGSRRAPAAAPPPGATCGRAGCRRRGDRGARRAAAPRGRRRPRRRPPSAPRRAPAPHPAPPARCGPRTASWRSGRSRVRSRRSAAGAGRSRGDWAYSRGRPRHG